MAKKHHKHKKKKKKHLHITYNEKIIYLVSLIITIILSLLITMFSGKKLSFFNKTIDNSGVPYTGSAVRKESTVRKEYEQSYREKQEKWNKEYQDILRNNEEVKELEELDFEKKKKK